MSLAQIPTRAIDVVGVFDRGFAQKFVNARPLKAVVKEESKTMEHPLETGAMVTDHRIIQPVEIELAVVIQAEAYSNSYQEIRETFLTGTVLTVQTKTGSYENMLLASMPHDENPEAFDQIIVALRFKEVRFVTAQFQALPPADVKKPSDSSTSKRGEQSGKTGGGAASSNERGSTAYEIFY